MPAWKIWHILIAVDPEIKLLNAQAWRSTCPDWPVIFELSLELAGPLRVRKCSEPAIFALRAWDVVHDRLWDRVGMCSKCERCAPLADLVGHRPYGVLHDLEPAPGSWMAQALPRSMVSQRRLMLGAF